MGSKQISLVTPQKRLGCTGSGGRILQQRSRNGRVATSGLQHCRFVTCCFSQERQFEAVWTKTLRPPSVTATTNILNATTLPCVIHTIVVGDKAWVVSFSRSKECEGVGWLVVMGSWVLRDTRVLGQLWCKGGRGATVWRADLSLRGVGSSMPFLACSLRVRRWRVVSGWFLEEVLRRPCWPVVGGGPCCRKKSEGKILGWNLDGFGKHRKTSRFLILCIFPKHASEGIRQECAHKKPTRNPQDTHVTPQGLHRIAGEPKREQTPPVSPPPTSPTAKRPHSRPPSRAPARSQTRKAAAGKPTLPPARLRTRSTRPPAREPALSPARGPSVRRARPHVRPPALPPTRCPSTVSAPPSSTRLRIPPSFAAAFSRVPKPQSKRAPTQQGVQTTSQFNTLHGAEHRDTEHICKLFKCSARFILGR